ncbi:MAG: hypothetical protein R3C54_05085 [Parvularculaceae bacterium]
MQGSIVDVLMPPLSASELTVAFVAGASGACLLVGVVTADERGLYGVFDEPDDFAVPWAIAARASRPL